MNIPYLIQVLQNKITMLGNARSQAYSIGDLEQLAVIEKELLDTQSTFSQLTLLQTATETAATSNTSVSDIIATGMTATQNTIQGPSAGAVVNGYDISAYATDPLHEQKIQNLISAMPAFNALSDVDSYIQFAAPGSPVTGDMVQRAIGLYPIDMLLLLAIMQNDSNFGTLGIGARTNNPGNVGNNGFEERTYPSWEEGVTAVAEWLSRHRYIEPALYVAPTPEPSIEPTPEPVVEKPVKFRKKRVVEEDTTPTEEPVPTAPLEEASSTPSVLDTGTPDVGDTSSSSSETGL